MTAPAVLRRWAGPAPVSLIGSAARQQLVRFRRVAPWGAAALTALVAHVALIPHVAVRGVAPDGVAVAVVAVAAGRGARAGAAFGFGAGLGADLFLSTPLGTTALAYTVLGHILGRWSRPGPPGAAAALCTPASACFACRTGRRHRPDRRATARRAAFRRAVVLSLVGVGAGELAVAVVGTALGGMPFPDWRGVSAMAGVAGVSAPLGPPIFAAVRRLAPPSRSRP